MEEEKGFEIRDRRAHLSDEMADEKEAPPLENRSSIETPDSKGDISPEEMLPVNLSSFILSLATSGMVHLGEEANPATGRKSVHLPQARQVIDLLSLLEEKTKGNLTKEEEEILSHILFTLRMKFVEVERKR